MSEILTHAVARLAGSQAWLVGVAIARSARASLVEAPTREQATRAVQRASGLDVRIANRGLVPNDPREFHVRTFLGRGVLHGQDQIVHNPRRGLRRWVMRDSRPELRETGQTRRLNLELFHDGAVVIAVPLDQPPYLQEHDSAATYVRVSLVEATALALTALANVWAEEVGTAGALAMRLHLEPHRTAPNSLMKAITPELIGYQTLPPNVPDESVAVGQFFAAESKTAGGVDLDDMRAAATQLAEDVVHQFGVSSLEILLPASLETAAD